MELCITVSVLQCVRDGQVKLLMVFRFISQDQKATCVDCDDMLNDCWLEDSRLYSHFLRLFARFASNQSSKLSSLIFF